MNIESLVSPHLLIFLESQEKTHLPCSSYYCFQQCFLIIEWMCKLQPETVGL